MGSDIIFLGGKMNFNFFDFDFLEDLYSFNRPVKDMHPYRLIKKENNLTIILNTLGISPEDLKIEIKAGEIENRQVLSVNGKTHDDILDQDCEVNMQFYISQSIEDIKWKNKNGFTYLELYSKEPAKPNVKISKILD